MSTGQPFPQSPMVWSFPDYQGNAVTITIAYSNSTHALQSATAVRDQGCLYQTLLWGLGGDGIPDDTSSKVTIPFGTTTIGKAQFRSLGFSTIDDILAVQFTVGF